MKIHGTAKGGAISKKDFGVAFGGAGGNGGGTVDSNSFTNDNAGAQGISLTGTRTGSGISINSGSELIGKTPTKITWMPYIVGSPSGGNLTCRIYTPDGTATGTLQATSTNSFTMAQWIAKDGENADFTFSTSYSLVQSDTIIIFLDDTDGTSGTAFPTWAKSTYDDSDLFRLVQYYGSWELGDDNSPYFQLTY